MKQPSFADLLVAEVEAIYGSVDIEAARRSVATMERQVDRFSVETTRMATNLRAALLDLRASLGATPTVQTEGVAHVSDLPITEDTRVTVPIPQRLQKHLENYLPEVLIPAFATGTSVPQGLGFRFMVTVKGVAEVTALLNLLYDHRSSSGWYTISTKVINDIEQAVTRSAGANR